MTATQEISLLHCCEATPNHEDWLGLVRKRLTTLVEEPRLLAELIWSEAARQATRHDAPQSTTCTEAFKIFDELDLHTSGRM